jgi:hypothetical protein
MLMADSVKPAVRGCAAHVRRISMTNFGARQCRHREGANCRVNTLEWKSSSAL